MIKIPEEFKRRGFRYELVESRWPLAIYGQILLKAWLRGANGPVEKHVGYEVMILRTQKSRFNADAAGLRTIVRFPSDEDFGEFGWHYDEMRDAILKYESLMSLKSVKKAMA